jgi:hypothetical protein
MIDEDLRARLTEPTTDDPLDLLKELAAAVGIEDYDYFDRRGRWVLYPQDG